MTFDYDYDHDYDVFLSHAKADRPIARELAKRLRADGCKVWFDEWPKDDVTEPGDSIPLAMERGLECQTILPVKSSR